MLGRCWHRWTEIVGWFARDRRTRARVSPVEYQALHQAVVLACRAAVENGDESRRAFYSRLEGLARPWLTANTLAHAERDILSDLYRRCREADRELNGYGFADWLRDWRRPLTMAAAVVGLVVFLALTREWVLDPTLDALDGWWRRFRFALRRLLSD